MRCGIFTPQEHVRVITILIQLINEAVRYKMSFNSLKLVNAYGDIKSGNPDKICRLDLISV